MYNIEEITLESSWETERARFDTLAGTYFMRRFAWMSAWWAAYQNPKSELRILKVSNEDQTLGYFPLYLDGSTNTLQLIGSGKACSDDLGIYVQSGHEVPVAKAVVKHLYDSGLAREWDFLKLEGVRNNTLAMNALLLESRSAFGSSFEETVDQPCRVINMNGSFDDYFTKCVSHSQRSKLRRDVRNHLDGGRITVKFADSLELARQQATIISDLHRARWESKGEAGCTADIQFQNLIGNAVESLYRDGMWFSMILEVDGKVASGMLGAKNSSHTSIYVSGMDPNQTEFRPGVLMNLAAIRYSCQQGCSHYDLMRGDESYKSRLGADAIPQYLWTAAAPRLVPRLLGRVKSTGTALKQWFKQYRDADQLSS